jgi:hypothetical protein
MGKAGVAGGVLVFLAGLAIFIDDLHDFIEVPDFFNWIPGASDPFIIGGFHFHHLYLGIFLMIIGLAIAVKYDE